MVLHPIVNLKKKKKKTNQLLPVNIQFLFTRMGLRAFGPGTLNSKALSFLLRGS